MTPTGPEPNSVEYFCLFYALLALVGSMVAGMGLIRLLF